MSEYVGAGVNAIRPEPSIAKPKTNSCVPRPKGSV